MQSAVPTSHVPLQQPGFVPPAGQPSGVAVPAPTQQWPALGPVVGQSTPAWRPQHVCVMVGGSKAHGSPTRLQQSPWPASTPVFAQERGAQH